MDVCRATCRAWCASLFDMQGVKGFPSTFPVEANGIHDAKRLSATAAATWPLSSTARAHPLKAFGGGRPAVAEVHPHFEPLAQKMARNAAPEKSRSAKHRYNLPAMARPVAA